MLPPWYAFLSFLFFFLVIFLKPPVFGKTNSHKMNFDSQMYRVFPTMCD